MTVTNGSMIRVASAVLVTLALTMTDAEARGFGGGFRGGSSAPRFSGWGRPSGPVRPNGGFSERIGRPGFAVRHPHLHPHWHRWPWHYGYGFGGLGLGLGLGGLFFDDKYPFVPDDEVSAAPVEPPATRAPVETAETANSAAAVAACARRFRTYDPATQTYVGKGYIRRTCP